MEGEAKREEAKAEAAQEESKPSLLGQILQSSEEQSDFAKRFKVKTKDDQVRMSAMVETFVQEVLKGAMVVREDTIAMINERIREIDQLISRQLDEVMHAQEFQKLEGSWRGLHYLVDKTETGTALQIRVFNTSKKDLLKDLERAPEFDQSALFKKIYEEEYGTLGGAPYGALIGDYEFGKHPQDLMMLEKIAGVAASAHAPFFAATAAQMFNFDSFEDLSKPRDLAKIFTASDYAKWNSFRDSDDSRYVGLAMPHILMRLPYGKETEPVEGFNYEEDVSGPTAAKYLWGNAAYAIGARLTDAFAKYRWCAAIRGVENGGLVEGLPTHTFRTDEGDIALKCPTEIAITDRREKELSDLGFIPLVHAKNTDYAVFFAMQSANRPKKFYDAAANANARLSSQLQYIMATSRFAHYLKVMMRDKVGSFMSRANVQDFLSRWIANYVLLDDNAGPEQKARYPLREARIDVVDDPARPGCYKAVAFLKPHFQLDELTVSLRLVAELPAQKK
jgi:type VI secretion system protein ImpC